MKAEHPVVWLVTGLIAVMVLMSLSSGSTTTDSAPIIQGARDKLYVLLGSFNMNEGLEHDVHPAVVSCLEVCKERYPGHANYSCSTSAEVLNHRGYISCYGAFGCPDYPEGFREGDEYTFGGCTALVRDSCSEVTYCWGSYEGSGTPTPTPSRLPKTAVVIGEYYLGAEIPYDRKPATQSCVDACAAKYPGYPGYGCSTDPGKLDFKAHASCFGQTGCRTVDDEFTRGTKYSEGACSAAVNDHCKESNFCWADPEAVVRAFDPEGRELLGSYNLTTSPDRLSVGRVRSCVEACEIRYPGYKKYACSTTVTGPINRRAWLTCHAQSGCWEHRDTYTAGESYGDGACSAYAKDNCKKINYCWADVSEVRKKQEETTFGGIVNDDDYDDDDDVDGDAE